MFLKAKGFSPKPIFSLTRTIFWELDLQKAKNPSFSDDYSFLNNTIGSDIYNYFKNGAENGPIAIYINSGLGFDMNVTATSMLSPRSICHQHLCSRMSPWSQQDNWVLASCKLIKVNFDEDYVNSQEGNPCKYHCVAITGITRPGWLGFQEEKYEIKNYGGKDEKHKYIPVNLPFLEVIWKEFDKISFSFKSLSSKLRIVPGSRQIVYIFV